MTEGVADWKVEVIAQPAVTLADSTKTVTTTPIVDLAVGAGIQTALAANPNRSYALVQNTGSANMRVGVGFQPSPTEGVQILPGGALELSGSHISKEYVAVTREGSVSTTCGGYEETAV